MANQGNNAQGGSLENRWVDEILSLHGATERQIAGFHEEARYWAAEQLSDRQIVWRALAGWRCEMDLETAARVASVIIITGKAVYTATVEGRNHAAKEVSHGKSPFKFVFIGVLIGYATVAVGLGLSLLLK